MGDSTDEVIDDEDFGYYGLEIVVEKETALTAGLIVGIKDTPQDLGSFTMSYQAGTFVGLPASKILIDENDAKFIVDGIGRGSIPSVGNVVDCQDVIFTADEIFSTETTHLFGKVRVALDFQKFRYQAKLLTEGYISLYVDNSFEGMDEKQSADRILNDVQSMLHQRYGFTVHEDTSTRVLLRTGAKDGELTSLPFQGISVELYPYDDGPNSCYIFFTGDKTAKKEDYIAVFDDVSRLLKDNYTEDLSASGGKVFITIPKSPVTGFKFKILNKATEMLNLYPSETVIFQYLHDNISQLYQLHIKDVNDLSARVIIEGLEHYRSVPDYVNQGVVGRSLGELNQEIVAHIKGEVESTFARELFGVFSESKINIPSELAVTLHGADLHTYEHTLQQYNLFGCDSPDQMKHHFVAVGLRSLFDYVCQGKILQQTDNNIN
jgi:hypothetical protein